MFHVEREFGGVQLVRAIGFHLSLVQFLLLHLPRHPNGEKNESESAPIDHPYGHAILYSDTYCAQY